MHFIAPHKEKKPIKGRKHKFKGRKGSELHKEHIHKETVRLCRFKAGESVIFEDRKYQLMHLHDEYNEHLEWDGLRCLICEIWDYGENLWCVHPEDIKRSV